MMIKEHRFIFWLQLLQIAHTLLCIAQAVFVLLFWLGVMSGCRHWHDLLLQVV